jgi:TFIIF-interacting CTD phosphatase-like protein
MSIKNVILDLDNTLISSEPYEDHSESKIRDLLDSATGKVAYYDMHGYYVVFERPGVQPFLDWLFANYSVSVWTAASKDYALHIIDHTIEDENARRLDWIFFDTHCALSKSIYGRRSPKNLRLLWEVFELPGYTRENTVIVDDLNRVYRAQPDNCIPVKAFHILDADADADAELEKVREKLKDLA